MSSESLHEARASLEGEVLDRHRVIASICEELEAVDWYEQRIAASDDEQLRAILAHNRDEEKEHAAMLLEWLRRHDSIFERHLKRFLFSEGDITAEEDDDSDSAGDGSLGIGSPSHSR
jgi:ferritin-like protein